MRRIGSDRLWVGVRSVGRPQLIAPLTTIYHCRDLIDGLVIVGDVDKVSELIIGDLSKQIKVARVYGNRPINEAGAELIMFLQQVDTRNVLFIDDDILFDRDDLVRALKEIDNYDIVTYLSRIPCALESTVETWKINPQVDLYFSLMKYEAFYKFDNEDMKFYRKYGGRNFDYILLSWIWQKRHGCSLHILDSGKTRPFHVFLPDVYKKPVPPDCENFSIELGKCENIEQAIKCVTIWKEKFGSL